MSESDHYGVVMNRIMLTCFDWKHQRPGMTCLFDEAYHNVSFLNFDIHSVAKVYAVLPFYNVKCLCSGGRKATPTSLSIFDFYGIKTL